MAFSHTLAIDMLASIPAYVREFKLVFGKDQIDIDQVTDAIAEFEKTLVTPNSRFDQWLLGNKTAMTNEVGLDPVRSDRPTGLVKTGPVFLVATANDATQRARKVRLNKITGNSPTSTSVSAGSAASPSRSSRASW